MCKGVTSRYVKENFDIIVYRICVENNFIPRAKEMAIRSLKYINYILRVEKNAISAISESLCAQGGCESAAVRPLHYFRSIHVCGVQTASGSGESSVVGGKRVNFSIPTVSISLKLSIVCFIFSVLFFFYERWNRCILKVNNIILLLFHARQLALKLAVTHRCGCHVFQPPQQHIASSDRPLLGGRQHRALF